MSTVERTRRWAVGAAAAVILAGAGAITGPVPAAQAQSGYRVCVAFDSTSSPGHVGTGLVVKVPKGAAARCAGDLAWMREHYAAVYPGSSVRETRALMTCEDLGRALLDAPVDLCTNRLAEGVVYRYDSVYDLLHPRQFGELTPVRG